MVKPWTKQNVQK